MNIINEDEEVVFNEVMEVVGRRPDFQVDKFFNRCFAVAFNKRCYVKQFDGTGKHIFHDGSERLSKNIAKYVIKFEIRYDKIRQFWVRFFSMVSIQVSLNRYWIQFLDAGCQQVE